LLCLTCKNLDPTAEKLVQERYTRPATPTLSRKILRLPSTTPAVWGVLTNRLEKCPVVNPAYRDCKSTSVQLTSSIHTLSVSGADNPSSRYHPPQFCFSTRGRVVPYKYRKALLSEPIGNRSGGNVVVISMACRLKNSTPGLFSET
jgi:hypothetical protein